MAGDVALRAALADVRGANVDVAGLSAVGFGLLSNVREIAAGADDVFRTLVVFGLAAAVVDAAGLAVVLQETKENVKTNSPEFCLKLFKMSLNFHPNDTLFVQIVWEMIQL